jgi:hypothetical protein
LLRQIDFGFSHGCHKDFLYRPTELSLLPPPVLSFPLLPPLPLSGGGGLPGQTRAVSSGLAGRRWRRGGAGVDRVSFRVSFSVARSWLGSRPWSRAFLAVVRYSLLVLSISASPELPWREVTAAAGAGRSPSLINSVLVGVGVVRPVLPLLAGRGGEGEGQDGERCGAVSLSPAGHGGEGRRRNSLARSATPVTQVFGRPQDFELVLHSCSLARLGDGLEGG